MTGTTFSVALPDDWRVLDIDPATSVDSLRRLLDEAARHDSDVRAHRAAIERAFRQAVAEAQAAGVQSCACTFASVAGLPVQASLTIATHSLEGEDNDVRRIFEGLADGETERTVEMVELAAGPAVRRAGRRRQVLPGSDEEVTIVSRQYYVPAQGSDDVVLLTFTSPTIELEPELCDLFDSMAVTFRFAAD